MPKLATPEDDKPEDGKKDSKPDTDARPADAVNNWVDRFAPPVTRPYLRLARFDRPVGAWLLLWPCWWSIALAGAAGYSSIAPWPDPWFLVLFFLGAFIMRGAGCTFNDIVDRDVDAKVERTKNRPIPSGAVSPKQAMLFMVVLCFTGFIILLLLPIMAIFLGVLSLGLVALYPFTKRFTYWPQVFLGLAFNWGALMGWAAASGGLAPPAAILYIGGIFWTLLYDTIYAHQDKEDDILVGVKSTALALGDNTKAALAFFGAIALVLFTIAGWMVALGTFFYVGLGVAAVHVAWQIKTLDINDSANCLARFRANHILGAIIFASIIAGSIF